MSKQKRQLITILSLCLLLVIAGIGYVMASKYQKGKEQADKAEETKEIELYSLQREDITKLRFVNASHEMVLVKEGDIWKDESDAAFPVNQEYVEAMLDDTAAMSATKLVVEHPKDIKQYELETPNYTIELTDKNGESKVLVIGMESAAAEGCYAYVDQADKIYVIPSNITGDFDYTRNQMMEVPEAPEINAEYVTAYSVKPAEGKAFAAGYDDKKAEYSDVDGWDISGAYAKTVPGSKEALQGLFGGLASMQPSEGVAYQATEKLLKQYGLAKPSYVIEVDYYTVEGEKTDGAESPAEATPTPAPEEQKKTEHYYRLSVGAMDDTEENYYVSVDGSEGIYKMPVDTINALTEINAFDYVSKTMHKAQAESLQSISFTYQGKAHEIKVTKKEVENGISEDGSPVYDYTILLDGTTELDEHAFLADYSSIFSSLVYSREIGNEMKGADKGTEPAETMKIITDSSTTELEFIPYDGKNFYEVMTSHGKNSYSFLADINVVENAMKQLLDIKTLEEAKAEEAAENGEKSE